VRVEIGEARDGGFARQCLERIAAAHQPVAVQLAVVARLPDEAHEADPRDVLGAEIAPQLLPRREAFRHAVRVAGDGVGAADDAVMVTGCAQRVGDGLALQQGDAMVALGQRPGGTEAGDAGADDNHMHAGEAPFLSNVHGSASRRHCQPVGPRARPHYRLSSRAKRGIFHHRSHWPERLCCKSDRSTRRCCRSSLRRYRG
jgi:hypothetical protein